MPNLVEQTKVEVRFALSQLAASNRHHEFEAMARALARATVTRNILPATGPVSAGGDHGRDFETFSSELPGQVQPLAVQMGARDGDGFAFACTLQQSGIGSKVRDDVATIVATGQPARFVVYYCEANVPVALRHRLQVETQDKFQLHLEIFDGTGIAELLSQHGTFWIAESFLNLHARTLPPPPDRPGWYEEDLARWQQRTVPASTWGDYVDLAGCMRYAYGARDGREDLPFWLHKLEPLLEGSSPEPLRRAAVHQAVLANHLGLGAMRQADGLLAAAISQAISSGDPAELSDATVLLMLAVAALLRGETDHPVAVIIDWGDELDGRVDELLSAVDNAGDIASLLQSSIALKLRPDLSQLPAGEVTPFIHDPTSDLTVAERMDAIASGDATPLDTPAVDLRGSWASLVKLTDHLPTVPLFPTQSLAQFLALNTRLLFDQPDFDAVSARLDERIAITQGDIASADIALGRASALFDSGQYLRGLGHLHRARNKLANGDAADRMVHATLATAAAYRQLNLNAAAKYFGLVAAALSGRGGGDTYAQGLFAAASAEYHQGNWLNATSLNRAAILGHGALAPQSFDFERHEWLNPSIFELTTMRALARKLGPPFDSFVAQAISEAGTADLLDSLSSGAATASGDDEWRPWWDDIDAAELQAKCTEEFGQPAFSDAGPTRQLRFKCLGVGWTVEFANEPGIVIVAERFAAVLQIALAHLATWDPALLPTRVTVRVKPCDGDTVIREAGSTPSETRFECELPALSGDHCIAGQEAMSATFGAVATVIVTVSTLGDDEWKEALDRAADEGLITNIQFAMPYDDAARRVRAEVASQLMDESPSGADYQPAGPGLDAPRTPGPGYSLERSQEEIQFRYEDLPNRICSTLPLLRRDDGFLRTVEILRSRGWLDWHILMAVTGVAKNTRLNYRGGVDIGDNEALKEFFLAPEPTRDPVPPRFFTEDQLEFLLRTNMTPFAIVAWHFALRQTAIDLDAVQQLLRARYGWGTDDVPHADLFR